MSGFIEELQKYVIKDDDRTQEDLEKLAKENTGNDISNDANEDDMLDTQEPSLSHDTPKREEEERDEPII